MPVSVQTTVSKESLADLSAVVQGLIKDVGMSASEAVTYAGLKIAASGRSASKLGKKNREIIDNPEWKQARSSFAWARKQQRMGKAIPANAQAALDQLKMLTPFLIVMRRQNKEPAMLPSYYKKDPRREIENRGLAKKTWNVMYGKLGAMLGGEKGNSSGTNYRVSKYIEKFGDTAGSTAVRIVNRLTYLEDAYPGITQTAIKNGTESAKATLEKGIAAATRRANKGK